MHHARATAIWLAPVVIIALVLAGCGGSSTSRSGPDPPSGSSPSNPTPPPVAITTTGLPAGTVGSAYSATLAASGGTAPYKWSLSDSSLPSGLSVNPATGAIAGTPSSPANQLALTFRVTDSSSNAQTATATFSLTISPTPVAITTTGLPAGTVGIAYSATLAASGGTAPYKWSLTAGSLPSGLAVNAATGAVTGTPSSPASQLALTFRVTDSSSNAQSTTATLSLTIGPGTISISISPRRAGLTVGQALNLTAITSDSTAVTWSVSPAGGSFSSTTSSSGAQVTLTAPQGAGVYTVKASSALDPTQSASIQIGVTNLPGVYTWHDDLARDGANKQEYALTPSDVNSSSFGKLFSCTVDGAVYAQPLWIANVVVNGAAHNVVYVATEHDSLFAFDADAAPCEPLWQVSLIDISHGGTGNETTIPTGPSGYKVGKGYGDLSPETGVTGTPVIDPATNTLYVVSTSMNAAGTEFYQRLHGIDITTGAEKTGSPVTIVATVPGTAYGGSSITFSPLMENQRPGLVLADGTVYIAWGSHEDAQPFYDWLIGYSYDGSVFTQVAAFNAAPNAGEGGIWMSGAAPAVDEQGRIYALTGNGAFDATSATAPNDDYGDSLLQLSSGLQILGYFTPSDAQSDQMYNNDFGSGGATVLADLPPGSPVTHVVIGGGKDGNLYLINRDSLGGFGDSTAWQELGVGTESFATGMHGVIFGGGAMWDDYYYFAGNSQPLQAYQLDPSTAKLSLATTASSPAGGFGFPGSTPSVSAGGETNGIVWILDDSQYCTPPALNGCGPAVLHAYAATNVANELWNSADSSNDQAGNAVKFTVTTIANGKVYIGTRGNNTGGVYGSTSVSGELDVYGLKP